MIAVSDPAVVALIAAFPATLAVVAGWLQAKKTRKLNTDEHSMTTQALKDIRADIRQTNGLLVDHISDHEAHRQ